MCTGGSTGEISWITDFPLTRCSVETDLKLVVHVEQRSLLTGDVTVCVAVWMFPQGNLSELGKLLMQGSFNVWTDHKKGHNKVQLLHATSHGSVIKAVQVYLLHICVPSVFF